MDEFKEIQVLPEGIFRVSYQKMSMRTVRSLYSRLQTEIMTSQKEQDFLMEKAKNLTEKIKNMELQLAQLRDFRVEHDPKFEAIFKAEKFLREFLGEERYQAFRTNRVLIFKAIDGNEYRIDWDGRLFKRVGNEYRQICIRKKSRLPLHDHIVSVITSVTEKPHLYQNYARQRQRR